jgi:hypothetical protein
MMDLLFASWAPRLLGWCVPSSRLFSAFKDSTTLEDGTKDWKPAAKQTTFEKIQEYKNELSFMLIL